MTTTHSYAKVTEDTLHVLEDTDRLIQVTRRPTDGTIPATLLPADFYEIETINGPIKVQGPVWCLWDADGFPYPVDPAVFDKLYLKPGEKPEMPAHPFPDFEARTFDREEMLKRVGGQLLNDTGIVRPPNQEDAPVSILVGPAAWVALALALNDMAKVRWMLERVETDNDEVWDEACELCGIDPDTLQREVEIVPGEPETPPPASLSPPNVRQMPNTEHTTKPGELLVTVDDPELSHVYFYAIRTDDIELARAMATQRAHEEDPSGKTPIDQERLQVLARYATVHGEELMP